MSCNVMSCELPMYENDLGDWPLGTDSITSSLQGWCNLTNFKIVWPCIMTNSLWTKPTDALNSNFIGITTQHVLGSLSAHHQEFLAVHRRGYILCRSDDRLHPGAPAPECTVWKLVYQLSHSAHSSCPNSARLQPTQPGILHMQLFMQSVLLMMGIMMPETCWVNLMRINNYTCGV